MDRTWTSICLCLFIGFLTACTGSKSSTDHVGTQSSALSSALLRVCIDPDNFGPTSQELDELGATGVRFELRGNGDLDALYAHYDDIIRAFHDGGKGVLLIVDYATVPRIGGRVDDAYIASFACTAASIAAHYGPSGPFNAQVVDALEIWNEPDLPGGNHLEPEQFARLLRATVNAIKVPGAPLIPEDGSVLNTACAGNANPGMPVISGGLAKPAQALGSGKYAARFVSAMGIEWDRVDGFGLHPYELLPKGQLRAVIDGYVTLGGKLLYFTEWGDPRRPSIQATTVREYMSFFADPAQSGRIEHVAQSYVFAWSDTQEPCDNGQAVGSAPDGTPICARGSSHRRYFGLIGGNGERTPAWQAFHDGAQTLETHYGERQPAPPAPAPGTGGDPAVPHGTLLRGTVKLGGALLAGVTVSVRGHDWQDFKQTATNELGIYAIEGLNAASLYDVVANGTPDPNGSYVPIDGRHQLVVRYGVELVAASDGWHSEDFVLDF